MANLRSIPPARLVPLHFGDSPYDECRTQIARLRTILQDVAEILDPLPLGAPLPEAEGVVLPQVLGEAYRRTGEIKTIRLPILIVTSEFGTVSMWDWEIASYLRSEGVSTLAPYDLAGARTICRALGVGRQLRGGKFLVYQDSPGEGFQASIFKRFYWWEDECTQRISGPLRPRDRAA